LKTWEKSGKKKLRPWRDDELVIDGDRWVARGVNGGARAASAPSPPRHIRSAV
jgi:hypothetical protein